MDTIIFIGTYKIGSSRDAIKAAKNLGYNIILLTSSRGYLKKRNTFPEVDEIIYVAKMNYNNLYKKCVEIKQRGIHIKLCISFIDFNVSKAAKLSGRLNLCEVSSEALFKMEDKTRIRQALIKHPSNPFYMVYNGQDSIESILQECKPHFPLILKPPVSHGSKDVFQINSDEEFYDKIDFLRKKYKSSILIEQFISGTQYIVEVLVHKGVITIVAIIEQELNKNFVVTGYAYPAIMSEEDMQKLEDCVKSILETLELQTGSCHLEMRLSDGQWKLIEINPRMSGGAMNQIIYEGSGINLAKETIKLYLGEEPKVEYKPLQNVFAQFITVNTKGKLKMITGRIRASKYRGVKKVSVYARKGMIVRPPKSMGLRYGYVIASSSNAETAKAISKKAAKEIKFHLDPVAD
ncbi:MAG: ATP-grasp protein [Bacillales bacterium]|jgi:biotin carboxylase|nr:ATP-grasp protein [Bacillales bacterium]